MSKSQAKLTARIESGLVEVKSKFDAEFRRFALERDKSTKYEEFYVLLEKVHELQDTPFIICYTDPKDGDLLPINNDDNYLKAVSTARPVLRLMVQRKGDSYADYTGYGTIGSKKKNPLTKLIGPPEAKPASHLQISMPEDFRRVSAIIDVDIIPESHRRVRLMKNGSEKPLGFYIRDGFSVRITQRGLEKVPGIFISRLVPGGLAESTGLLAVNDEVLEVNGIEVSGKTLDQVTDMMVANSANLIITVKPVNQHNNISPKREGSGRSSASHTTSVKSGFSLNSDEVHDIEEVDEEDEVKDHFAEDEEEETEKGHGEEGRIEVPESGIVEERIEAAMEDADVVVPDAEAKEIDDILSKDTLISFTNSDVMPTEVQPKHDDNSNEKGQVDSEINHIADGGGDNVSEKPSETTDTSKANNIVAL